ncbi:ATP-dependent DNA helicase RecG [Agromyces sp. SYSU T00194]|uniref:ATP-dependent DNA helicase RecG n=1 Tax=Agromyces chitinivorans TaxID=3158560 RepID=UPI0033956397
MSAADAPGRAGLDTKLDGLLGGRTSGALRRAFGHVTAGDLLGHYPRRYARRGELTALAELPLEENVTIVAQVLEVRERSMRQRRGSIVEVTISDGTGVLTLTFFNQKWRAAELVPGARGVFAGKVTSYRGARQLAHPDYELFEASGEDPDAKRWAETPIPIYPATSTVASWQVQKAIGLVLDALGEVADPVPPDVRERRGLLGHRAALEAIHRPEHERDWSRARAALRFQEAFVLQSALLATRAERRAHETVRREAHAGGLLERFDAALPFALTGDQRSVGAEITADLDSGVPMNRLVQGEVGSGKTLVALRAMVAVAESGGQTALLAPTEVLAAQHLRSISRALGPELSAELMPTLVTGQLPAADRKRALLRAASGQARIVVGTHALLGDTVTFADLGLVVVDEQHRFGVDQREALRVKGTAPPHVLVLTATPIPRTVAMTVFGDLDVSTIRELPAGRPGISSFVVPLAERPGWFGRVWARVAEEVGKGHRAFVVCPAIEAKQVEEDDGVDAGDAPVPEGAAPVPLASVLDVVRRLGEAPEVAGLRIAPLHGRLSADEKEATMRDFAEGRLDVVVATTVIEVGVDVPDASTMVVLDAERFGVSQLHQLRGRVGRGTVPGLCLLVTNAPEGTVARERVDAVAGTTDGFELARIDLELRQEGDVLGSSQSGGRSSLKLLRVARDGDLIVEARGLAQEVLDDDPTLAAHPELAAAVRHRLDAAESEFLNKA